MNIKLPEKVTYLINELNRAGFEAYAVGGCVRDSILGREPEDWDVTTSAKPEEVREVFAARGIHTIDTGIAHGTVTVMIRHEGFEVTTYRIDGDYGDARHPDFVRFTADLMEDLKRRDFTINAMAYSETAGLVDEFGGLADLEQGIIRCVGNPVDRFNEDALRMMRAVRFAAQLGFEMDEDTRGAIPGLAPNLARISAERIQTELVKLLVSPHPDKMRDVYDTGMAYIILPEFSRMMETAQNNPNHHGTVGEHTICSLAEVPPDKVLRLTMLLHDVGKPDCKKTDGKGIDHFHGHPQLGAEMAGRILRRLKFDNDTIARVKALVKAHDDRPYPLSERAVRRAIYRDGEDCYPDIFTVKRADILAQSSYLQHEKLEYLDEFRAVYDQIIADDQCLSLKDLAVTGSDLIDIGLSPGPTIGRVLRSMLDDVLEDPSLNTKETLLNRYRQGNYSQ
ncbi:MAG: HD domain-containing protein [Clostridiales bacterium]|nr:HD domain-containing protein [Clostridiales bacterium]